MKRKYHSRLILLLIVIGGWAVSAIAQPNLIPFKPSGWSDKIVVARMTGTTTDSTGLTTADTLYISWAVINNGTAATASTFFTYLYVDGVQVAGWGSAPPLNVNSYTFINNYSIGSLSSGTHTIQIVADATGIITETNETDNSYTKTISLSTASFPNLTPYQPAGWSDKIVVARTTGTTTDSTDLTSADTLYVNWAIINNGLAATSATFTNSLYVDGVFKTNWPTPPPLNTNAYTSVNDFPIGSLTQGNHTVQIVADATGQIAETNESDNAYTKNITVYFTNLPAPMLISPANGSTGQSPSPTFTWSSIAGASAYRIMAASSAADLPSDPSATNGGATIVLNAISTNTSFTPSIPFNMSTSYYWEVRALNGNTQNGIWSSANNFTTGTLTNGLTIIPTFDSSITTDPQAAIIEATINSALVVYQTKFSDSVTVTITFEKMSSGMGQSQWFFNTYSYSTYRAALASHATTADDNTALAHLPNVTANPVNGNVNVKLKLANARALGFSANPGPGQTDAIIRLNIASMNLSVAQTSPSKYSLFATVSHETDEVLGLGSALDEVVEGSTTIADPIFAEDLFRYDQTGARSYATNASATAYFSLDGTNNLAQFNQVATGDFGDWYSFGGGQTPEVQDAFAAAGATPMLGVELRALDAIGYTAVASVPKPVILTVADTNNSIVFTWSAVSGQNYQVQVSTNLAAQSWTNLGGVVNATSSSASFTNTVGPDHQRFYRVEIPSGGSNNALRSQFVIPSRPSGSGTSVLRMGQP